ncbi:MAG: type II toxin-antitoxin system RelB/DinJ family antitoxin [Angelakisella sp.]
MENLQLNIKIDPKVQLQAQQIFDELGLDMSTAVNIFLKQSIRQHGIPFPVTMDMPRPELPNSETLAAIEEVHQMKLHPELGKSYTDVDEMMKELLA